MTRSIRGAALVVSGLLITLFPGGAEAQSAADNIRPAGQVCLAGQPCVGTTGQDGAREAAPTPAVPEPETPVATALPTTETAAAEPTEAPETTEAAVAEPGQGTSTAAVPESETPVVAALETTEAGAAEPTEAPETTEAGAAEPAEAAASDSAFDAAGAYQMSCFACHGTGLPGAPQTGDAAAWDERMAKGMDAVMTNVINGINTMPPRGICMTCSDDNLRAIVDYMLAQ